MKFLVIVGQGATRWGAHVPDLPGCVAVGDSRSGVVALSREAADLHIDQPKQSGDPIATPRSEGVIVETSVA